MVHAGFIKKRIKFLFSAGIEPYVQSLEKHGILGKKNILDVGCGPGEWTFAAAKLNSKASLIGIDINEMYLNFAVNYMKQNNIENCEFLRESYENLLKVFQPESFDVIMCNSVIQYIDEKKAFFIFSRLLRRNGILIMFYNHALGYYLHGFLSGIKNLNYERIRYAFRSVVNTSQNCIFKMKHPHHFVSLGYLRKNAKKVGIVLTKIESEPKLTYRDRYLGIPYVFSCKGIKI